MPHNLNPNGVARIPNPMKDLIMFIVVKKVLVFGNESDMVNSLSD